MPTTNTPIFPQTLVSQQTAILHGTGLVQFGGGTATGTMSPIFTPGPNGAMLTAIVVQNTDTATCTAVLMISTAAGATTAVAIIGAVAIAGAGTATTYNAPGVNLLNGTQGPQNLPFDSCGNRILYVAAGSTLNVGLLSTIIGTFGQLSVTCIGGNF